MKVSNLNELFLHELKDLYDAEHQLVETLPKLAEAANNPKLAEAFRNHLERTQEHVSRLEEVFAACGEEPERKTCRGMKGLLEEAERLLKDDFEGAVLDAGLIGAAQRVEHYEIAAYGTLKVWAATGGFTDIMETLEATLEEEKTADDKLTEIAQMGVNLAAERGNRASGRSDTEADEEDEGEAEVASTKRTANRTRARTPARRGTTKARR